MPIRLQFPLPGPFVYHRRPRQPATGLLTTGVALAVDLLILCTWVALVFVALILKLASAGLDVLERRRTAKAKPEQPVSQSRYSNRR
jgi:hypothetical protein